jgi:hypothetical protein
VVLGWIPGSHLTFSFRDSMRESIKELMNIEYSTVEWELFPKTICYTRPANGVKLSTSGVSIQVTKQAADKVETMREDIAMMWQTASINRGGTLVGKYFVPFGKSRDMGDDVTTEIIHRQNTMLKTTKQRVVTNLNDIDMVIKMEISNTANFGEISMFTLREAFLSYTRSSGDPVFSGTKATHTGGSYLLLFNEENSGMVDSNLMDVDEKLNAIGNWEDGLVHYRYITLNNLEVAGQKGKGQGKSFWKDHYKLMCGSILEVVHIHTFNRPPQRRSQNVQMSYRGIAKVLESLVTTKTQNKNPNDASVETTIISNLSRQDNTHMSGLSIVTGLSITKKRMEEIDKQRDEFMTKQQRMEDSFSSMTS